MEFSPLRCLPGSVLPFISKVCEDACLLFPFSLAVWSDFLYIWPMSCFRFIADLTQILIVIYYCALLFVIMCSLCLHYAWRYIHCFLQDS